MFKLTIVFTRMLQCRVKYYMAARSHVWMGPLKHRVANIYTDSVVPMEFDNPL